MTPKSFLSFLEGYKSLYAEKLAKLGELASRMTTGLLKLDEASESVDELSKELVVKEQDLVVANKKADKVSGIAVCARSVRADVRDLLRSLPGQLYVIQLSRVV